MILRNAVFPHGVETTRSSYVMSCGEAATHTHAAAHVRRRSVTFRRKDGRADAAVDPSFVILYIDHESYMLWRNYKQKFVNISIQSFAAIVLVSPHGWTHLQRAAKQGPTELALGGSTHCLDAGETAKTES